MLLVVAVPPYPGGAQEPWRPAVPAAVSSLLRATSQTASPAAERVVTVEGVVSETGTLIARVSQRLRGDAAVALRDTIRFEPAARRAEVARTVAAALAEGGEVIEAAFGDVDRPGDPIVLDARVLQSGFLAWAEPRSTLATALPRLDLPATGGEARPDVPSIEISAPLATVIEAEITLPPGYTVEPPAGTRIERDFGAYSSSYTVDGRRLTTRRVLEWRTRRLAGARAADYLAFVDAVRADEAHVFAVEVNPIDGSVPALMGRLLWQQQEYGRAVEAFERAIAVGKAEAPLLMGLGDSLLSLERDAEGVAALRRGVQIDGGVRTLGFAARVLARCRVELDLAADWAGRALARARSAAAAVTVDTLSREQVVLLHDLAWAWASMGRVLASQGRDEEAEAWLTAAWAYSADPNIGEELGTFYEARGDTTRALATYGDALAMNRLSWPSIDARIARLASADEAERLARDRWDAVAAARAVVVEDGPAASSMAYFAVAFDAEGTITKARFAGGDESVRAAADRLVGRRVPYRLSAIPGGPFLAPVNAACTRLGCGFLFLPFYDAVHATSDRLRWEPQAAR
ncbi:MAG: hypothetical protein KJ066_02830 [Acidobacteria bacterium]|nr:hypothetical protein [Acidobacteriota bacterium]